MIINDHDHRLIFRQTYAMSDISDHGFLSLIINKYWWYLRLTQIFLSKILVFLAQICFKVWFSAYILTLNCTTGMILHILILDLVASRQRSGTVGFSWAWSGSAEIHGNQLH